MYIFELNHTRLYHTQLQPRFRPCDTDLPYSRFGAGGEQSAAHVLTMRYCPTLPHLSELEAREVQLMFLVIRSVMFEESEACQGDEGGSRAEKLRVHIFLSIFNDVLLHA